MTNKCTYCKRAGSLRVSANESPLNQDIYVCDMHWNVLKDPKSALPFLRGSLSMNMRGSEDPTELQARIDKFMNIVKSWKPSH